MAEASSAEESETRRPMATDSFTLSSFVDEVECRVEKLRRDAIALMGERASLLMVMDHLKSDCLNVDITPEDCQELLTNMERLKARCEAVQIAVHTVRDEGQQQSLNKVNTALEELQSRLTTSQSGPSPTAQQVRSYLNACLPEPLGPIDSRFQSMVLGCTVDDQKDVRRRLQSLVRECGSEPRAPRSNQNGCSGVDCSNNSARAVDATSSLPDRHAASTPLPSSVVVDERSGAKEGDNHLTEQWSTWPKDLSSPNKKTKPVKTEEEGGVEGNPLRSKKKDSNACNKERDSSVSHFSS